MSPISLNNPLQGISFPKVAASSILENKQQVENSINTLSSLQLEPHLDPPKNWDTLSALSIILREGNLTSGDKVLDAGGEYYSVLLKHLASMGFSNLFCLNLAFDKNEDLDGIHYMYGDITNTDFESDFFSAITCLSVIEHGVDLELFFFEAKRILKPSGVLVISTDFWESEIDTQDKEFYGVPIKIFDTSDLTALISTAERFGMRFLGPIEGECRETVVSWQGFDFTFVYLSFIKE